MKYVALFLCFSLIACHQKPAQPFMPIATKMPAPIGAIDYCNRHPTDEKCVKETQKLQK
jgi:predicted transglutaminase-like cysteine proteinase